MHGYSVVDHARNHALRKGRLINRVVVLEYEVEPPIGAAGAIFAGWLAWIAVQMQIRANSQSVPPTAPESITTESEPLKAAFKLGVPLILGLVMFFVFLLALGTLEVAIDLVWRVALKLYNLRWITGKP